MERGSHNCEPTVLSCNIFSKCVGIKSFFTVQCFRLKSDILNWIEWHLLIHVIKSKIPAVFRVWINDQSINEKRWGLVNLRCPRSVSNMFVRAVYKVIDRSCCCMNIFPFLSISLFAMLAQYVYLHVEVVKSPFYRAIKIRSVAPETGGRIISAKKPSDGNNLSLVCRRREEWFVVSSLLEDLFAQGLNQRRIEV